MVDWSSLSPDEFEELCTAILYKNNFHDITKMGNTNDRDRGRDIVAYKTRTIMSAMDKDEKWIVQCKRYLASPPKIAKLRESLDWCKVHKPDGMIFFITNRLASETKDWLDGVKKDYGFDIRIADVDFLDDVLSRDPQLQRRFFEKPKVVLDPWYESLIGPRPPNSFLVYTAGEMPEEVERGAIGEWRQKLESEMESKHLNVAFFHPEFVGCDHGGINPDVTVSMDSYMIQKSDAVIAYLTNEELLGTITEIMLSYFQNKKIAIFIDESILYTIYNQDDPKLADVNELYSKVFKTKHSCPCNLGISSSDTIDRSKYWFLLNFLVQNRGDLIINVVNQKDYVSRMVSVIENWVNP